MSKQVNKILLVDDDEPTNFLHEKVLKKCDAAKEIVIMDSAQRAIDYLNEALDGNHSMPNIIFLDINMPAMNGWEFIEAFKKINEKSKINIALLLLTTSLNPDDLKSSYEYDEVLDFISKPLNKERVEETLQKYDILFN